MGRRSDNRFKRLDVIRAIKAASDAGIAPGMVEIVAKDGTVIRVYDKAASEQETTTQQEVMSAKGWDDEIAKLKAKKDR
jgi:hypothetical protein